MINHFRTVLANVKKFDGCEMFIDESFHPIDIPVELKSVWGLLYKNAETDVDRIEVSEQLFEFCYTDDFLKYIDTLDTRHIIRKSGTTIYDLYKRQNSCTFDVVSILNSGFSFASLFKEIKNPVLNGLLAELKDIFYNTDESVAKARSLIIALSYQLSEKNKDAI